MFPSGPFDFVYAPHNPVASTGMNMTFSLTDPFMIDFLGRGSEHFYLRSRCYDFHPYQTETVSAGYLQEFSVVEFGRGGLYAEPRFLELARRRASAVISGARSKYEYIS